MRPPARLDDRRDWQDIGYSAIPDVQSHCVIWRVIELVALDQPLTWVVDGNCEPPTEAPDCADTVVEITVKWDGCAHYSWPEGICTHTCDGGRALAALIVRVNEATAELLPTWWQR